MNTLIRGIEDVIKNAIEEYSNLISNKFGIESEELENLWNNVSSNMKISVSKKTKSKSVDDTKDTIINNSNTCPYVFSKGEKTGEVCGGKPKKDCQYCSRHTKFEGIGQVEKKKTPKNKKSISESKIPSKKTPEKKTTDLVIRLNKQINKFWDPKTELVFKSKDERVVVSSFRNDSINKLTDDDIMLCEQFGFKYEIDDDVGDEIEEEEEEDEDLKKKEAEDKKKLEKKEAEDKKKLEKKEAEDKKKLEKKESENKKKLEKKDSEDKKKLEKKSITDAIQTINMKALNVEELLSEIQLDDEFVEEEEVLEEEY